MSEADAIKIATINSADHLGLADEIGTLEPGKKAGLIAVPGNPLQDIRALHKVVFVMKDGVVFKHENRTKK